MCAYMNAIPKKAGEVVRSPTAWATVGHEPPDVGAGNQTGEFS